MKDENKRTLYLKVRVSPEEMDAIKRKFQNSEMDTLSGFVRAMIFEGYIVQMDGNELQQIHKLASNIASSINQIAVRVNSTGNIYADDIAEIKDGVNKLWQPLNFLQTKILQLKHWTKMKSTVKRFPDNTEIWYVRLELDRLLKLLRHAQKLLQSFHIAGLLNCFEL